MRLSYEPHSKPKSSGIETRRFEGLHDELNLAAFLLALRPPSDVLDLMWGAKNSNFDAWCGFDSRFLGVGGVSEAINQARSLEVVDTNLVDHLADGNKPLFSDGDIAELMHDMVSSFPTSLEDEAPSTWFRRASDAGANKIAKEILNDWADTESSLTDHSLQNLLSSIGYDVDAAEIQRRVLATSASDEVPRCLIGLAELERLAGLHEVSFGTLRRSSETIRSVEDRNRYLHRCLVEECFRLSFAAAGETASSSFELGEVLDKACIGWVSQNVRFEGAEAPDEWLPLVVLEEAERAAEKLGETMKAATYKRRVENERRRIGRI